MAEQLLELVRNLTWAEMREKLDFVGYLKSQHLEVEAGQPSARL